MQSNLGHATAAFTLDVYGHFTDDMRSVSAQRMEGFITSVKGVSGQQKNLEAIEASRFFLVRGTGLEPTKRCFGLSLFMPASTIMWGNYAILLPSHVR